MSQPFNPGSGWVMQQFEDYVPVGALGYREDDGSWTYWVREEPMPPLPTEPYTVIRVTWRPGLGRGNDNVRHLDGDWEGISVDELFKRITGFEVLSEPRAVTAKAVLDRVRRVHHSAGDQSIPARFSNELDHSAREFGVES